MCCAPHACPRRPGSITCVITTTSPHTTAHHCTPHHTQRSTPAPATAAVAAAAGVFATHAQHTPPHTHSIMGRARRSLVQKLLRAADSPYFELPKAWHVLSRYRTAELFLKHPAPPRIRYKDHTLYQTLAVDKPEVKQEPLCINSSQASLTRRLVGEQFATMKRTHQQTEQQQRQWLEKQQQYQQQHGRALPLADEPPKRLRWHDLKASTYSQAVSKLDKELTRAGGEASAGGYLEFIQEQEEDVLQAAAQRLKQQQLAAKFSPGGTGAAQQ